MTPGPGADKILPSIGKKTNPVKRVSVVGATGYTGAELCALLFKHPRVAISGFFSSSAGERKNFGELHPSLTGKEGPAVEPFQLEKLLDGLPDCVFLATPNEVSAELVPKLLEEKLTIIDLSGAYRLKEAEQYPRWYGFAHSNARLLAEAVYGLTEWSNGHLVGCRLVANSGCYPTSILLALKPLVPLVDFDQMVICDSKSGVSGAGRKKDFSYSFGEISGNFKAYNAGTHRHEPEIRQELGLSSEAPFLFVPHLLPLFRGLLSTIYVNFKNPVNAKTVTEAYHQAYRCCSFVRVHPAGQLPELKDVVGTPRAEIGFVLQSGGLRAVIVSVLDNLLKGAASQAVQNFNRLFGFAETEGLA